MRNLYTASQVQRREFSALRSPSKGFAWQADSSKWQREVTVYSRNLCIIRKTAQSMPVFANPGSNCFMPTDTKGMRKEKKKRSCNETTEQSLTAFWVCVFSLFFSLALGCFQRADNCSGCHLALFNAGTAVAHFFFNVHLLMSTDARIEEIGTHSVPSRAETEKPDTRTHTRSHTHPAHYYHSPSYSHLETNPPWTDIYAEKVMERKRKV